jgi:transmembrane sensor
MKDTKNIANDLLDRYLAGECTQEERTLVEQGYNKFALQNDIVETDIDFDGIANQEWIQIQQLIGKPKNKRIRLWKRLAGAAAVIFLLGIGILYRQHETNERTIEGDILPGGNKAYLTLSNGEKIELGIKQNGKIATQNGISVTKASDGRIIYNIENQTKTEGGTGYNTIETPKGGQYQLVLPDGSTVWLNAASSLRYSLNLKNNKTREVELQGEAYFEIQHDKLRPFKVKTDRESVEVLGTHFNVNSYHDDPVEKTTLLEGSVKISGRIASSVRILEPGEQGLLSESGNLTVSRADPEAAIAWKNGLFIFEDEKLADIMKRVSRWYNVDIVYQDVDTQLVFGGSVSRYDNVSKVLGKLEKVGGVHFKVEGRRIIVTR